MGRTFTHSFTSASVTSGSSLNTNRTGLPNAFNIVRIKVTPNTGGAARVQLFQKDTFLTADLVYNAGPFTSLIDPYERGTGLERNQFPVCFYEDEDATGELHIKIFNDHTVNQTYAVEADVEEIPISIYKSADESVLNNTLQADDHLTLNVQASGKYVFRALLFVTHSIGTAGIKAGMNGSSTATSIKMHVRCPSFAIDSVLTALNTSAGANNSGTVALHISGTFDVNAAGTFYVQWAQNTTDAVNATTVQKNSYFELIRIA